MGKKHKNTFTENGKNPDAPANNTEVQPVTQAQSATYEQLTNSINRAAWERARRKNQEQKYPGKGLYHDTGVLTSYIEVFERIGVSEHSDVYRGQLTGSGKSVTIKVDRRRLIGDGSHYDEVYQKIEQLTKLNHKYIAQLIDFIPDFENNRSYIIMQYIEGKGLNRAITDDAPYRQDRVLDWACELLKALHYLHKNGFVHGGIRPSSVVLTDGGHVCFVDFHYLSDDEFVIGPGFNRLNNQREFQKEIYSDLSHLGKTLFQALTGVEKQKEIPYEASELRKAMASLETPVSPSVADVIVKAIHSDSGKGYQSASEMYNDLHRLPYKDPDKAFHMRIGKLGWTACVLLLIAGCCLYDTGQYQTGRAVEMRHLAVETETLRQSGNYSEAIDSAVQSVTRKFRDPPLLPEAQEALADALSVYNAKDAYKPYRSDYRLRGSIVQALFSPDGNRIAVAADAKDARYLQVFDAASAEELVWLPMRASLSPAMAFLDNDTLVYAGRETLLACDLSGKNNDLSGWKGIVTSESTKKSTPTVSIAVSEDKTTLVSLNWENGETYLYDADDIRNGIDKAEKLNLHRTWLDSRSGETLASMPVMLALNADGSRMAVSFPNGEVWIYSTDGTNLTQDKTYYRLYDNDVSNAEDTYVSRTIEGGFFNNCFCMTANYWINSETVTAKYMLLDMQSMETFENPKYPLSHVLTAEGACFLSVGGRLYRSEGFDAENTEWMPVITEEESPGEIIALSYAAGRILVVTASKTVIVYRENGDWRTDTAGGEQFQIAGLSPEYLCLAKQGGTMLSVLKWNQSYAFRTLLTYNQPSTIPVDEDDGNAGMIERTDYDNRYAHWGAHIRADGDAAVLFSNDGFRIYGLDSDAGFGTILADISFQETLHLTPNTISGIVYERAGSAEQERLKIILNDTVKFFSVETGEEFPEEEREKTPDELSFTTKNYRVVQQKNGPVSIFRAGSNTLLKEPFNDTLTFASQYGTYLLVSAQNGAQEQYTVLLDAEQNEIARIPGPCEALTDGRVIFDDEQGHLKEGRIYDLKELLKCAQEWGKG